MESNFQKHTVSSYDKELTIISKDLITMSDLVGDIISVFIETISEQNDENIAKVRKIDSKVNELDKKVEDFSTNIIALRNPLAVDLRYVISAIKISTIIERQGDMVKSATKKLMTIDKKVINQYSDELTQLSKSTYEMLSNSVKGFSEQSTGDANKVWRVEDKVDDLSDQTFERIKEDLKGAKENVDDYVSMMLIVKALERFGDYCTKITKAVHYVTSGKRVSEGDF